MQIPLQVQMMKKNTPHITGSIRWFFIDKLAIYFLFFSFLLSAQVGNGVIYVSNETVLFGSHHINTSSEISQNPNSISFVGNIEMIDFSGDSKKGLTKIQTKKISKKEAFNIQKEAKKKIAKKLNVPKKVNVVKINPAKQDTFFHTNSLNASLAVSTLPQWSAKKAIVNSSFDEITSKEYQDKFFIGFHRFFLIAEVNNASAFIRPPPKSQGATASLYI